jgi:disulfide bond formation protein DsbB
MTTAQFSKLFAILSLLAWGGTLGTITLAVLHRRNPESSAGSLFEDIRRNAVWFAFVVATVTMFGSLYLSQIAHFVPCPLCWYQRICMYPLSVALLVGALRRDREVWAYVVPPAVVGTVIAIYHTQLQAFPKQAHFCKLGADSCLTRWVWEFGFVSIPFMSLAAFVFIITMMLVLRSGGSDDFDEADEDVDAAPSEDALSLSARGAS